MDSVAKQYLNKYETFSGQLKNDSHALLRKESIQRFAELGFPTTKNEEWKYTNVLPITKVDFRNSTPADKFKLTKEDIKDFLICESRDKFWLLFSSLKTGILIHRFLF